MVGCLVKDAFVMWSKCPAINCYWFDWFCYVHVHKINSSINTASIPRRQPLPSPLKAPTCTHTWQSLDIHCDCTQEYSRHCPQNVSVYICSLHGKSLYSTWNAAKQGRQYLRVVGIVYSWGKPKDNRSNYTIPSMIIWHEGKNITWLPAGNFIEDLQ